MLRRNPSLRTIADSQLHSNSRTTMKSDCMYRNAMLHRRPQKSPVLWTKILWIEIEAYYRPIRMYGTVYEILIVIDVVATATEPKTNFDTIDVLFFSEACISICRVCCSILNYRYRYRCESPAGAITVTVTPHRDTHASSHDLNLLPFFITGKSRHGLRRRLTTQARR